MKERLKKWLERIINCVHIDFNIWKMFAEWYEVKDYYKFPSVKVYCGKANNLFGWHDKDNWLLYFQPHPINCKAKQDFVDFEDSPYLVICLFNYFKIVVKLYAPNIPITNGSFGYEHEYWQSMVDCLYEHNGDFTETYRNWGWQLVTYPKLEDGSNDYDHPIHTNSWEWNLFKQDNKIVKSLMNENNN